MAKPNERLAAKAKTLLQRRKLELIGAIETDDAQAVKELLQAEPSLAAQPLTPGLFPLALAAVSNTAGAARALFACPATDPDASADAGGLTPLMLAASHGASEALAEISKRANLWARDQRGKTALHWAIRGVCPGPEEDALALARAMGERVDCADRHGWTPLLMAAMDGKAQVFAHLLPLSDLSARSSGPGLMSFGLSDAHLLADGIAAALRAFQEAQALDACAGPAPSKARPGL